MHEAGIAARIAEALSAAGVAREGPIVHLRVRGGHDDTWAFDEALRLHLLSALPELDAARLRIDHEPMSALCVVCQRSFESRPPEPLCPTCGTPGLVERAPESVAIELEELQRPGRFSMTSTERPT